MCPHRLIHSSGPTDKMPLQRSFFAYCLLLFFAAFAGSLHAKDLSLEEAEQMAVETSLEVRLAGTDVKIRENLRREAASAYYPQIHSRLIAPFVGRESGFFADQIIWDFGRTGNRLKSSRNLVKMAEFSKKHAVGKAVLEVRKAFYKVLLEQARLVYAEKNHRLVLMKLERSRILERNGRISPLEFAEQESDESSVLFELRRVENQVEDARFAFFQLIGVENGSGVSLEVPPDPEGVFQMEETLSAALGSNPFLRSLAEQLKSDEANIAAARAEFLPVVYGRVAYRFKGDGAETPAFIAGAGAAIPIFKGFSRFAGLDRAKAARERTQITIALEKQRLERKIKRLLLDIEHSDANIKLSRQILGTVEKRLILAREKKESGAASNIELVFSEKEYAKFYLNYEESVYNKRVLLAELSFLTGKSSAGNN